MTPPSLKNHTIFSAITLPIDYMLTPTIKPDETRLRAIA
jgi:hypothetical protein